MVKVVGGDFLAFLSCFKFFVLLGFYVCVHFFFIILLSLTKKIVGCHKQKVTYYTGKKNLCTMMFFFVFFL